MCLEVYVGAKSKLPTFEFSKESPGFYIWELSDEKSIAAVKKILGYEHLYEVGSHMGCACGFSYGEWSRSAPKEDHESRVKDVVDFCDYLRENAENNELKLFCTWWQDFPESYESEHFDPGSVPEQEFEFSQDVILKVEV